MVIKVSSFPSTQSTHQLLSSLPVAKEITHTKLYKTRGAQYEKGMTTFSVFAPNARNISVILTAFGKEEHKVKMLKNSEGVWEAATHLAQPDRTYLYLVEDCHGKHMLRTDPFSFSTVHVPEAGQVQSVVVDPSKYQWLDQTWIETRTKTDPLQAPLSIYELQLKSWKSGVNAPLNFKELAPELISYCKKMGFTHVEIFGILDHYFRDGRGYQVANFFSPYNGNGNCDDLKYFIDQLHQSGIGVIIDWIPTHFQHYHQWSSYSVSMHEFDGTDLFAAENAPWGTKYLDYSKEETRRLMSASALYFLDELHVDGIRYDAISQMVHRNHKDVPSGISFLQELNDTIRAYYPGVMTIAEETEGFPNVTKPTKEGGLGFDLKWDIGWSHDSRNFLRTPYSERPNHWQHKIIDFLTNVVNGEKVILTHSHDDTDSGEHNNSKVLLQCVTHEQDVDGKFANLKNFFAWQTLAPSWGHMIHMGDEMAQNDSWYQRFRKNLSSVDWLVAEQNPKHKSVQNCIRDLNTLYLDKSQLWAKEREGFKLISEYGPNGVVAYHRGTKDNKRLAIVHNFSNKGYSSYDIPLSNYGDPLIHRIKNIGEIFSTDHLSYGGSGKFENKKIEVLRNNNGNPTHLRLSLPPQSTLVLEEELL
jgi:1,4-alpha-glucan branching enzyme